MPKVQDARILILATSGFEESELFEPRKRLIESGAKVTLASPSLDEIQGEKGDQPGRMIKPDLRIEEVDAKEYDALLLPGGTRNPDHLRMNADAVRLVRDFAEAGKPVGAICHGPWMLVEADVVRGRRVTSWPSIRTDLKNAGGVVVDEEAVIDGNIVTSRNPDDIPAFTEAFARLVESTSAETQAS